ncbi:MAG: hypothetical protein R3190_09770, partial [Thermoanaerobaculia bacterium]|nr:hypothetical protein [Thermoanaerobaculia bacterium]
MMRDAATAASRTGRGRLTAVLVATVAGCALGAASGHAQATVSLDTAVEVTRGGDAVAELGADDLTVRVDGRAVDFDLLPAEWSARPRRVL